MNPKRAIRPLGSLAANRCLDKGSRRQILEKKPLNMLGQTNTTFYKKLSKTKEQLYLSEMRMNQF